jgi:hypothetical protein
MSVNVASGKRMNASVFTFPIGARVFRQGSGGPISLLKTAAAIVYACNA